MLVLKNAKVTFLIGIAVQLRSIIFVHSFSRTSKFVCQLTNSLNNMSYSLQDD